MSIFKKRIIKEWEEREDGTIILHGWNKTSTNEGISVPIDKDLVEEIQAREEKRLTTGMRKSIEKIAITVKQVIAE